MFVGSAVGAAALGAAATAYSAYSSSKASSDASDAQVAAQREVIEGTKQAAKDANVLLDKSLGVQKEELTGGTDRARNEFMTGLGKAEDLTRNWRELGDMAVQAMVETPDFSFTATDFSKYMDPSYQWRFNQGVEALDRSGAARGMLLSGAQNKALMDYGQEMASQEYNNAFARAKQAYDTNQFKQDRMASFGQNATNNLLSASNAAYNNLAANENQLGVNLSNAAANTYQRQGDNLISGAAGVANAVSNIGDAQAANALNQGQISNNLVNNLYTVYKDYQSSNALDQF